MIEEKIKSLEFFNKRVKVLCIGDIMLDNFVYGNVDRISPEAPVPVLKYEKTDTMLGGAGNVVANLLSLGCETTFFGLVGNDLNSKRIEDLLKQAGAKVHLLKIEGMPTIIKTRYIAGKQHILRLDVEEKFMVNVDLIKRSEKIFERLIQNNDAVVLSDYNKGVFSYEATQMLIKLCNKHNKFVLIDPKGSDYSKYAGASLVKPNLKEFKEASGSFDLNPTDLNFYNALQIEAKKLQEKFLIKNLAITLSEHGIALCPKCKSIIHFTTCAREVCDVSGAGDTTIATMATCVAHGYSLEKSIEVANKAAGIVVSKLGTSVIKQNELVPLL